MLIRDAEVWAFGRADVRLKGAKIEAIGQLTERPGEPVLEARGGALLPGLHDHHIHLAGLAARAASVTCGPPEVNTPEELACRLQEPGHGWIRGVGYHESVMGLPDAKQLDHFVADRPLRIQHRSGRLWLLNSRALAELTAHAAPPPGLDLATGHLFDEDRWLQMALGSRPPDLSAVSKYLARHGVTGVTDMTPQNGAGHAEHVDSQRRTGSLLQRCVLAGTLTLDEAQPGDWAMGPAKLHLHEAALPDFDEAVAFALAAHDQNRGVAIHCVSEVELVFALALLEAAGAAHGDRIEHASITAPEFIERMAALGLAACVQPHFVFERGDRYLADVEPRHHADLYRLRSLRDAGLPLAGGSDAPFGRTDPWNAIASAVSRRTREGRFIGAEEALTPEEAVSLYLADPLDLSRMRRIASGEPADLCLLDRPWSQAREALSADLVRTTFASGRLVHDRVDQAPG